MASYIRIFYKNVEHDTIQKLLDDNNICNISVKDFLEVSDPFSELKNRDLLFNAYKETQKKELNLNSAKDINESTPIYPPCILYCPDNNLLIETTKYVPNLTINKDFNAFLSDKIKNLIDEEENITNDFTKSFPKCSIWIWSKAMVEYNEGLNERQLSGTLINISDFLLNVSTNVSETGGNFSISVDKIPSQFHNSLVKGDNTQVRKVVDFKYGINATIKDDKFTEYVVRTQLDSNSGALITTENLNKLKKEDNLEHYSGNHEFQQKNNIRTSNLINLAINKNDIVFIKFESLKQGSTNVNFLGTKPVKEFLPGNYFDMIGLVDTVSINSDSQSVNISIQGRDLMKLLLDDSSYFFTQSYSNKDSEDGVFMNAINSGDNLSTTDKFLEGSGVSFNRFFATGLIMPFWNPTIRNMEHIVETVIKSLANIQICPDALFDPYLDKTTFRTEEIKNKK